MKTGNCETIIFYLNVIQKNQNNAGTLSLRSARSGLLFIRTVIYWFLHENSLREAETNP